MPKKKLTNEQFVKELMSYNPTGALCQVFIIEALRAYAEEVVERGMPEDKPTILFNPQAWFRCAEHILKRVEAEYGK